MVSGKAFSERILEAKASKRALRLRGGGTKDFYGNALQGDVLDTRDYAGIVDYEPTELVISARCGTPLAELEEKLAANNQYLPFEPPHFGAGATLGGCVAAGLSGPRRASAGAVRDFVLGTKIIDGSGRELAFGGQVMKNVAGYDISRLLAGSLGTLGLILEVSLKVLPRPGAERTLKLELPQAKALESLNRWAAQPLPITASAWEDGELSLRLACTDKALPALAGRIGGEAVEPAAAGAFWRDMREQTAPFFSGEAPLWRLSVPSHAPAIELPGAQLVEWGGGLRWLKTNADAGTVRAAAAHVGGHATLFRAKEKTAGTFAPLSPLLARLHRDLKAAFDPAGIFNPGRLYEGL